MGRRCDFERHVIRIYLYDKAEEGGEDELFAKGAGAGGGKATRRDGISDAGLAHF